MGVLQAFRVEGPILLCDSRVFLKYAALGFSEASDKDSPELRNACVFQISVLAIVDFIFRLLSVL